MTRPDEVFELVRERLAAKLQLPKEDIKQESRLDEDLGLDSLRAVELLIELEDRYGVVVADEQAAQLLTVGQVADFIAQQLPSQK